MRRAIRWAVSAVCLIAAVLLGLAGSIALKKEKLEGAGITLVSLDGGMDSGNPTAGGSGKGVTAVKVQEMLEAEAGQEAPIGFTAWEEETDKRITDGEGLRSADTTAIHLFGTSEYLLPYGKILQASDKEGCLIGEGSARKLFGSSQAEGLTVCCGEQKFVIRGVIKEPEEVLIFQETRRDAVFHRITLEAASGKMGKAKELTAAEKFQNRHGLSGMEVLETGESPLQKVLSLVPGKWSDFAGWRTNLQQRREEEQKRRKLPKSILDVTADRHKDTAFCLLAGSLSALLLGMAVNISIKNS